jgi:outer membrane protein TolC
VFAVSPAFAQPAPKAVATDDLAAFEKDLDGLFVSSGLTADQAAARAGTSSATVRRRIAEVEAAIASAEAAELSRIPQVGGKLSYTRLSYIAPLMFGTTAFEFFQNNMVAEAQLNVPLSDYLLRYPKLIDAAHLAEEVARTSKRSAEVTAGEEARLAYYEWVRSKLQVLIADRQLAQVRATLKQVRALADVQRLSKADLLRVESQEAQAEQVVDQLKNLSTLREEQLRLQIGAGAEEVLSIGEDIRRDLTAPNPAALDELVKQARARRLDLKVLDTGIEAKEKQAASELATRLPRLSAFAVADYANPNPRYFPPTDQFKFTWSAGAQLTWTLNDTLIGGTTQRRLEAETSELRADRENLLRGTRLEVLASQQAVQIALHALATTQKGLTAAEEGYRVRRELLAAERATAVELVDAETDLTRARIAALDARVDLRVAMAQLAHALGDDTK